MFVSYFFQFYHQLICWNLVLVLALVFRLNQLLVNLSCMEMFDLNFFRRWKNEFYTNVNLDFWLDITLVPHCSIWPTNSYDGQTNGYVRNRYVIHFIYVLIFLTKNKGNIQPNIRQNTLQCFRHSKLISFVKHFFPIHFLGLLHPLYNYNASQKLLQK